MLTRTVALDASIFFETAAAPHNFNPAVVSVSRVRGGRLQVFVYSQINLDRALDIQSSSSDATSQIQLSGSLKGALIHNFRVSDGGLGVWGIDTSALDDEDNDPTKWSIARFTNGTIVGGNYHTSSIDIPIVGEGKGPDIGWETGDIVWNTAGGLHKNLGWINTVAGNPGTWERFGIGTAGGAFPPATCAVGAIFVDTDPAVDTNCTTTADNSLCLCILTDTWITLENN